MSEWFTGAAPLIVGALLAVLSGWVSNRWAIAREREGRSDTRRDQILFKRHESKRETLLRIQEAAVALGQASTTVQFWHGRKSAKAIEGVPPPAEAMLAQGRMLFQLQMLVVRSREPELAELVDKALEHTLSTMQDGEAGEDGGMSALGQVILDLHRCVAKLLVALDEAEDRLTLPKPGWRPWQLSSARFCTPRGWSLPTRLTDAG